MIEVIFGCPKYSSHIKKKFVFKTKKIMLKELNKSCCPICTYKLEAIILNEVDDDKKKK